MFKLLKPIFNYRIGDHLRRMLIIRSSQTQGKSTAGSLERKNKRKLRSLNMLEHCKAIIQAKFKIKGKNCILRKIFD